MEVESKYHVSAGVQEQEVREIEAARKDPKKFAVLYDRYYEQIFRFVYQRVDDRDIALDTTQQVFLKALSGLSKYEYRGVPFSSWLYRVALNEVTELFRKNEKYRTVNIESATVYVIFDEIEEKPLDKYYDKMIDTISRLPEDELQLIEMRFFEKRSFREIGQIENITENNAKVRLYRILEKVKKLIAGNDSKENVK